MLDLLMPRARAVSGADNVWDVWGGTRYRTRAGVVVDEEIALTYEMVFGALRVLAEGVGGISPLPLYERKSEYDRGTVDGIFDYMVNDHIPAGVFREGRVAHQVGWGNGFAEIERDTTGKVKALYPIHPSRVEPAPKESEFTYLVRNNSSPPIPMYAHEILHIPGALSDDGIWGRSVIRYGRETIGGGIATARAAQAYLGSGGQPKGVLEIQGISQGQDGRAKRAAFREEWNAVHNDVGNPTIAIVPPGTNYKALSHLSSEANQVIQSRMLDKANIATLFGIPAYKIGAGESGVQTAGNIEQLALEFVVFSLLPWARKFEEQCGYKLLRKEERHRFYFEHNFTALLRGEPTARYAAYHKAFSIGVLSQNDIRRLENMSNIGPQGDQYFVPANMTTSERAMNGDMGNGRNVGSDTSGFPGEGGGSPDEAAFHQQLKALPKLQRQETIKQLADLRSELPERKVEWLEAARSVLGGTLRWMMAKESAAITAAAKNNDFPSWLRGYYAKHYPLMVEALTPACDVLRIAGVQKWERPEDLAAFLKSRSMEIAESSWNTDTPTVFARKLAAWPSERAKQLIEELTHESSCSL